MTTFFLADAHAVVTGGGRGIGAAIAVALAGAGARLTILGRDPERLADTARGLPCARAEVTDVTDPADLKHALARARAEFGPVRILVNNAGTALSQAYLKLDEYDWRQCLEVNLMGAHHCTQATLPDMIEESHGRVINIASTAALRGYAYVAPYVASKHALLGLTRALASEFSQTGVTFNAVCPGYTETEMLERTLDRIIEKTGRPRNHALDELVRFNPQRRLVQPEEVARTVLWLCGEDARSITGQAISVSGGETC